MVLEALFWVCAGLLLIPYGIYPLVGLLGRLRMRVAPPVPEPAPPVAVVMAVHNGEDVLRARVDNLWAQDYPGPLCIHLGLDGCTDGTEALAQALVAEGYPLYLHTFPRIGKVGILEALLPQVAHTVPFLALTDLRTHWAPDTLRQLIACLSESNVGVVTAVPARQPTQGNAWLESRYLNWEVRLKVVETRICRMLLGAFGPGYALRSTCLPAPLRLTPLDDLALSLQVQPHGWGGRVAREARFYYTTGADLTSELRRKRRFGLGAGWFYRTQGWALLRRSPPAFGLLFLHKGLRWVAPFSLLALAALGLLLFSRHSAYLLAPGAVLLGAKLAILRATSPAQRWPKALGGAAYALAAQGALLLGWIDFLRGRNGRTWQPSHRPLHTAKEFPRS